MPRIEIEPTCGGCFAVLPDFYDGPDDNGQTRYCAFGSTKTDALDSLLEKLEGTAPEASLKAFTEWFNRSDQALPASRRVA